MKHLQTITLNRKLYMKVCSEYFGEGERTHEKLGDDDEDEFACDAEYNFTDSSGGDAGTSDLCDMLDEWV